MSKPALIENIEEGREGATQFQNHPYPSRWKNRESGSYSITGLFQREGSAQPGEGSSARLSGKTEFCGPLPAREYW
ncbi:MAG: hypothetical protein KatS3mg111_3056 [Pirellulaceae bacterium]|nr:MAG: hypothetical protein KatS3mg111_3056 [Pirellulaceae bacterium]